MPRGFHPVLLILALASPGSVGALGLGDIHVDSALNEPLSAQIEIVGASLDDLTDLRAVIASSDTFQRYAADRPAYLNSSTFKIGRDAEGRPVLNVRSRDSFTDPLVSFLVDLKWRNSELVREYSLLLDPAGMVAARREVASTVVADAAVDAPGSGAPRAVVAAPSRIAVSPHAVEAGSLHRITSRDTLRAIVRHAGARSETEVQRMMIATFRANPGAFLGNINRLHRGIVLTLPTSADMAAISPGEAKHDVDQQMTAWRTAPHAVARPAVAAVLDTVPTQSDPALTSRLHSLEQQLVDLHQQIAKESANIQELKQAGDLAAGNRAATAQPIAEATPAPPVRSPAPMSTNTLLGFGALLLGAILTIYGYLRSRLQRQPAPQSGAPAVIAAEAPIGAIAEPVKPVPAESPLVGVPVTTKRTTASSAAPLWPPVAAQNPGQGMIIEVDTEALERSYLESLGFNTSTAKPGAATGEFNFVETSADSATAEIEMSDIYEAETGAAEVNTAVIQIDATTKVVPIAPDADLMSSIDPASSATTELDFNLSDLDATAQHVQLPSALNEHVEVSEGRTNIIDVLKMAIDRDPHRRDLRLKLTEIYYNAATGNRRAFMEVVRKLARERESLSAEEWSNVVRMGRDLAPDDILFTDLVKDEDDVAA